MNAYELADELQQLDSKLHLINLFKSANMLRQQADRIAELEKSQRFAQNFAEEQHRRACQLEEAQQSAEPVAWINRHLDDGWLSWDKDSTANVSTPLYTTPQIKELSDEEIYEIGKQYLTQYEDGLYDFARAILKKASEK